MIAKSVRSALMRPWCASQATPAKPPLSSSTVPLISTLPFNATPDRRIASAANTAAAIPAFMSHDPRPQTRPSRTSPPNGSIVHPAPAGTTSKWPLRWTSGRSVRPRLVPTTLMRGWAGVCSGRPTAGWYSTAKSHLASVSPMNRAHSSYNSPGGLYEECARFIGDTLARCDFAVEYHPAVGRPEHTPAHPRINVVGTRRGRTLRPLVHLNGHFDVVPAGAGWTMDPFGGEVREGRVWGRGSCDMKAGIAAAVFAAEAIRRSGVALNGSVEISGTVDEESGGFAGVAWLAHHGRISADRTDFAIIPEPLYVCLLYTSPSPR